MGRFKTCCLLFAIGFAPALAQAQVGDTFVIVRKTPLKVGGKVLQTLAVGRSFDVYDVQGDWFQVSREKTGWVNRRDLETPKAAIAAFSRKIEQHPDDADTYVARGTICTRRCGWIRNGSMRGRFLPGSRPLALILAYGAESRP